MKYRHLSEVTNIEVIRRGAGVRIRTWLNQTFGTGTWRKLKGHCTVEYVNGQIWLVELHWFEAHGIGKHLEKDKRKIRRIV